MQSSDNHYQPNAMLGVLIGGMPIKQDIYTSADTQTDEMSPHICSCNRQIVIFIYSLQAYQVWLLSHSDLRDER